MKNLKTTALGVLTIVSAVATAGVQILNGHAPDWGTTVSAITAGLGLIAAKDHTTPPATSSDAQALPKP